MERERERGEKHETERDGDRETTTLGSDQRRVDEGGVYPCLCLCVYRNEHTRHGWAQKKEKKKQNKKNARAEKGRCESGRGGEKWGGGWWRRIGIHGRWKCNNKHYLSAREPLTMRIRREKRLAAAQKRKFFAIKSFRGV